MIFIQRNTVAVPSNLRSAYARRAAASAKRFFDRAPEARSQQRFEFESDLWEFSIGPLEKLFHGKCAYCESPATLAADQAVVAHFRPIREVTQGAAYRGSEGYWWLAYEWDNLYLVCRTCEQNKHNNFPVSGARAQPGSKREALKTERAYLLDPCVDTPADFMTFDKSGRVAPRGLSGSRPTDWPVQRASITIDLLGLNRDDLIRDRQREATFLREGCDQARAASDFMDAPHRFVRPMFHLARPFAGMRRELLVQWCVTLLPQLKRRARADLITELSEIAPEFPRTTSRRSHTPLRQAPSSAVEVPPSASDLSSAGYIKSVRIRNVRSIGDARLAFPVKASTSWKLMLGENGTGKSSVLQAIALALMGEPAADQLLREAGIQPKDLIRSVSGTTEKQASVDIEMTNGAKIKARINARGVKVVNTGKGPLVVRAYGSARLLPRAAAKGRSRSRVARRSVGNLFRPGAPLLDANRFLLGLPPTHFNSAARAIKDLLHLPKKARLRAGRTDVTVEIAGTPRRLSQLSSGYESVLAMAVDIMSVATTTAKDLTEATGIVLIDEIDAHLHPRWKMTLVERLRKTFSSMQFLVTSHDPLCLHGLQAGEVALLRATGGTTQLLEDLPSPSDMRIDQILTSSLFGLSSTTDPHVDERFSEYYSLLAKRERNASEERRREVLKEQLKHVGPLGATPRDQQIYAVIDQYLAHERVTTSQARRTKLADATRRELYRLWNLADTGLGRL